MSEFAAPIIRRISIARFNRRLPFWMNHLRFWMWSKVIRVALQMGYMVVIIGRPGSGKSIMLDIVTPGRVICKFSEAMSSGKSVVINDIDVPDGLFSIDEPGCIDKASFGSTANNLAAEGRAYVVATQNERSFNGLLNGNLEPWKKYRGFLIVYMV